MLLSSIFFKPFAKITISLKTEYSILPSIPDFVIGSISFLSGLHIFIYKNSFFLIFQNYFLKHEQSIHFLLKPKSNFQMFLCYQTQYSLKFKTYSHSYICILIKNRKTSQSYKLIKIRILLTISHLISPLQ